MASFEVKELEAFRKTILAKYSKSRYNGIMQNLRALLDEAVGSGVIDKSPARDPGFKFSTLKVPPKDLNLPTDEQFKDLCAALEKMKNGCGHWVVQAVKFLALTSSRIDQASRVLKSDVKLEDDVLLFRKEIIKGGLKADSKDVPFPLYPELKELVKDLLATQHRRGEHLLPVRKFYVSLHSACDRLGFPHWTPHDFRHLMGTKLISPENQKHLSIADAALLFFHRGGGALLLSRYAHVMRNQLKTKAQNITMFTPPNPTAGKP